MGTSYNGIKLLIFAIFLLLSRIATSQSIGIPERFPNDSDVWNNFVSPPRGYGEVPFFWWQGDTLTREKLTWQLDQMATHHVSSLQINYSHTDNGKGLFWGLTLPSKPALFSEDWWNLFGWFMQEAKKRGMTVSLSDYTLGVGQGYAIDEAKKEVPDIAAWGLHEEHKIANGKNFSWIFENEPISVVAYPMNDRGQSIGKKRIDLTNSVQNNKLEWRVPKGNWKVVSIYKKIQPNSYNPLHPLSGKAYIKHFFQPFEDRFPELSKGGLNFFFSDELNFNLKGVIWSDNFRDEFLKRKGYDIVPELDALFEDIGDRTPKIRIDYNDVFVSLSEENFFEPVYSWHQQRGLIYGCDHGGRGMQVDEFGDYFRTQKWNQGPGCDQPKLGKNIIKDKVASSISHMYLRPRTWLEGFYGSGWSTTSSGLTDAIFANFAMGQNLLSLHGLYYATPGGWWEWAPPCNHYRMPYWQEMDNLLACTERLSFLLSQGFHCADIAILYPVESVIAENGNNSANIAFSVGEKLYSNGIDFDFMDYESLKKASVKDKKLNVSGESFQILIIPSMKTIRYSSLEKALDFKRAGGTVICVGDLPEASERQGYNDEKLENIVNELFSAKKKGIVLNNSDSVVAYISRNFVRDFYTTNTAVDIPYIMHRKIGSRDFYALYNVPEGSECFFRAKGNVEMWNPWDGTKRTLSVESVSDSGTYIKTPLSETEMQIFIFDKSKPAELGKYQPIIYKDSLILDSIWRFELEPVLYNKWGDFYWPGTDEKVGAEVNFLEYLDGKKWKECQVGYTSRFKLLQGIKEPLSEKELFDRIADKDKWEDLIFSWRWGVLNDYGHQGYHGLKLEMYDDFIRLGITKTEATRISREKNPDGDHCYLFTYVFAPSDGIYDIDYGTIKPLDFYINRARQSLSDKVQLKAGANEVLLHYTAPCTTYLVFKDKNKEGMFVHGIEKEKPLAMRWNGDMSILPFDLSSESYLTENYRFKCAPGLNSFTLWAYGDSLYAWTANEKLEIQCLEKREDGLNKYIVKAQHSISLPEDINFRIEGTKKGFSGTASIPYPIKQSCAEGLINIGDWTKINGLRCYSGGAWYRKVIHIDKKNIGKPIQLDLGNVVSTARVYVNDNNIGLKMTPPWTFDIGKYLHEGDNSLDIKIYNTAGNHYESIPTAYRGIVKAGILGPIRIRY